MKAQKIVPIVILMIVFIGGVLWRLDEAFYSDRTQALEFQLRTQSLALSQNFQTEINFWQKTAFKDLRSWPGWMASAEFGKIDETFVSIENSLPGQIKKETLLKLIKGLPPRGSLKIPVAFDIVFDQEQKPRGVVWVHQEGHTHVVLTQAEPWQGWIETMRSPNEELFIVTNEGISIAHGQRDYIGQKASDHPIYKMMLQSAETSQLAQIVKYSDQKMRSVVAEKIPNSNLTLVLSLPIADAMIGRTALRLQILTLGLGVLSLLLGFLFFGLADKPIFKIIEKVILPGSSTAKTPSAELDSEEKIKVYKSIAGAVGHELRAPLSSILAMSQSLSADELSKTSHGLVQSILRETREARNILDKILGFSGQSVKEKIEMKLESPVRKILKKLEPVLQGKNVEVKVTIDDQTLLPIDQDSLMKAIENIIINSVESMDRQLEKKLFVSAVHNDGHSILAIEDNGQGMDSKTIEKAKDPFFTTRSFAHHLGLGLAEAEGILKEHHAEMKIQSNIGKGTRIEIHFRSQVEKEIPSPSAAPISSASEVKVEPAKPAVPRLPEKPPEEIISSPGLKLREPIPVIPSPPAAPITVAPKLKAPEAPENIDELFEDVPTKIEENVPTGKVSDEEVIQRLENIKNAPAEPASKSEKIIPKPDIQIEKTKSALDNYKVSVRRPGSRSP